MQITLRHQPAYSVARVQLEPNEALQLEAGAMVAMSSGVELTSKMEGGFLKSLSRSVLEWRLFLHLHRYCWCEWRMGRSCTWVTR